MTTWHVPPLSLTLTAMASRLPRIVWAVLLGGIFILACTTPPPETLAPTDEPRVEITATPSTIPRPPLSPDAIATWRNAVIRVESGNRGGSGFIVARQEATAFLVTNMHVVRGGDYDLQISEDITVYTSDGLRFRAKGVGHNSSWDVAVLAICCSDSFAVIPWESGREGLVGEDVLAIRYMDSSNTVTITQGNITVIHPDGKVFTHDAFLNPGDSGSPLLATDGSILGINKGTFTDMETVFTTIPYDLVSEEVRRWLDRYLVLPTLARAEEASPPPGIGGGPDDIGDLDGVFGDPDDDIGDDPPLPETVESAGFTFVCEDLFSADEYHWALNDYLARQALAIFMMEQSDSLEAGVIISVWEAGRALDACLGISLVDPGDPGDVFGDPDDDIGDDPPLPETVESAGFTFVCEDLFSADEYHWALNDYLARQALAIFMMEQSDSLEAGVIISVWEADRALDACLGISPVDPGDVGDGGGGGGCDPGDPSCRWWLSDDDDVGDDEEEEEEVERGDQVFLVPGAESPQGPASHTTAGLPDNTYTPIGWGVALGSPNDPPSAGNGVVDVDIGGLYFLCNDITRRHLSDARIIAQTDLDRDLVFQLLAGYMMVLPYVETEIPGPDISPEEAEQAWKTCTER